MYYILDKHENWSNTLGYHIYNKLGLKKPPKRFLKVVNEDVLIKSIDNINSNIEIDDSLYKIKTPKKQIKKPNNIIDISEDTRNYIRMDPTYKFSGINPYADLVQGDIPDDEFLEMIYIRSKFSKELYNLTSYNFSDCTSVSEI